MDPWEYHFHVLVRNVSPYGLKSECSESVSQLLNLHGPLQ